MGFGYVTFSDEKALRRIEQEDVVVKGKVVNTAQAVEVVVPVQRGSVSSGGEASSNQQQLQIPGSYPVMYSYLPVQPSFWFPLRYPPHPYLPPGYFHQLHPQLPPSLHPPVQQVLL